MHDDELTPSEKEAMEALPRERMPNASLEDRVVEALRGRGLLKPQQRRVVDVTGLRVALAVAASVALLVGGIAIGRWTGPGQTAVVDAELVVADDESPAAALQQAGSAFLAALDDFVSQPEAPSNDEMRQGTEVALKTLYTATDRVTTLVPRDRLADLLSQVLATRSLVPRERLSTKGERHVIWF